MIVILGAFGLPLVTTAYFLLNRSPIPPISEQRLEHLFIVEPIILVCLGTFLYVRGWTIERLGLKPSLRDTFIGFGLAIAAYVGLFALWVMLMAANLNPSYLGGGTSPVNGRLLIISVIAVSAINPVFEEVFVCGYIVTLARQKGRLALGVNASVALRLTYHLYQGGVGVVGIIPFGLVLAWWYGKTGRLWPAVVAHAATDLAAMLEYVN
jgi:membrane protease YdiL (CAAX protease family)